MGIFKLPRITTTDRTSLTLGEGELVMDTDIPAIFFGDGATVSGIRLGGTGDVVGPSSAVNNRVVFFDGTTGKLIKDSGLTLSGTNTGDQTISLTGDVTGSGTGSFAATIANNTVTLAKMANIATSSILGRNTAGTGNVEVLSIATLSSMLSLSGTNTGDETTSSIKTKLGAASSGVDGYLTGTDWTTFNNKVSTSRSISTSGPLSGGGDLSANRTISISQATTSTDGYLSSTDWNTFNGKQAALSGGTGFVYSSAGTISYVADNFARLSGNTVSGAILLGTLSNHKVSLIANTFKMFELDGSGGTGGTNTIKVGASNTTGTGGTTKFLAGATTLLSFDHANENLSLGAKTYMLLSPDTNGEIELLTGGTGSIYLHSANVLELTGISGITSTQSHEFYSSIVLTDTVGAGGSISLIAPAFSSAGGYDYILPEIDPATSGGGANQMLISNSAGVMSWSNIPAGNVVGPASSVNNRVAFFDGTTGKLLKDSGLTLSGSNTGDQTISLTGDVTGSGTGSFTATIGANRVALAMMAQLAANSIIGNNTGSPATPLALTGTQVTAMLDTFDTASTTKGLVTGSNGVGTGRYLNSDGTWKTFSTGLGNSSGTITATLSTGVSGGQSVIGGTASGENLTLSSTSHATKGKLLFGSSAYNEATNCLGLRTSSPSYMLHGVAGTLADGENAMLISATIASTITAQNTAVQYTITGAGSSSFNQQGIAISFLAGYTGSSTTVGLNVSNANAGTGTGFISGASNFGVNATCSGTTTGRNVGGVYIAQGGDINQGVLGRAIVAKNSATNIGVVGAGVNTGTSPIFLGGYFTCGTGTPSLTSAALMCDNDTQSVDIFVARDNGTKVWTIVDGGNTTWADAINMAFGTTTGTKIGTATSQKIGFWNASPIIQPTTGVASATRVAGATTALVTDTYDGYTVAQVVKALRNLGILA